MNNDELTRLAGLHGVAGKTLEALLLVNNKVSWRDAAARAGVHQSTIMRGMNRIESGRCRCCGQPIK